VTSQYRGTDISVFVCLTVFRCMYVFLFIYVNVYSFFVVFMHFFYSLCHVYGPSCLIQINVCMYVLRSAGVCLCVYVTSQYRGTDISVFVCLSVLGVCMCFSSYVRCAELNGLTVGFCASK